ncbi:MAG: hypothetical protein M3R51_05670 [Candidatus Eremiobacteraeota bacterium]|nr:hypothetical protein [Candidatus Eremiobacteraeota bacterium]
MGPATSPSVKRCNSRFLVSETIALRLGACSFALAALLVASTLNAASADYTTFHFDNARDGWNDRETALNQSTASRITQVAHYVLDGEVDAQPLYLHGRHIAGKISRTNIAYVVTENDSVYAIAPQGGIVWKANFGAPVPTRYVANCMATAPTIGIQGTPVIDTSSDTMYFVAFTLSGGVPKYTLHAVSPENGVDKETMDMSPAVGDTSAHRQRAGLLLANGKIYVAFGGFCDRRADVSYGRVLAYDARTLALVDRFATTASPACGSFHFGTIWALGFAPAADRRGSVYFATGNGCIDYSRVRNGGYSDAVLRLTPTLRLASTHTALFAPCGARMENVHDQEIGSGGVALVSGTRFAIAGGKTGVTYVLDRMNLGGFHVPCPDRVAYESQTNWGLWGGPVTWQRGHDHYVAIPGTGPHGVRVYALDASTGALSLRSQTGVRLYNGGESVVLTSDGKTSGTSEVLWALTRPTTGVMYLQAYNPSEPSKPLISVAAGSWGNEFGYAGVSPTVVDGYVFVASNKELTVWACCNRTVTARDPVSRFVTIALIALAGAALFGIIRRRGTSKPV